MKLAYAMERAGLATPEQVAAVKRLEQLREKIKREARDYKFCRGVFPSELHAEIDRALLDGWLSIAELSSRAVRAATEAHGKSRQARRQIALRVWAQTCATVMDRKRLNERVQ